MTYGYCPVCGAPVVSRERRINGNDRCEKGHCYESRLTIQDTLKKCKVDYIELGKRLVACKHWRWVAGMRDTEGYRLLRATPHDGSWWAVKGTNHPEPDPQVISYQPQVPDLSDAATIGCVTKLVCEIWPQEKWKQLGRSHSEIMKKLTWLGGPGTEEEVLLSLLEQAADSEELAEGDYGRSGSTRVESTHQPGHRR